MCEEPEFSVEMLDHIHNPNPGNQTNIILLGLISKLFEDERKPKEKEIEAESQEKLQAKEEKERKREAKERQIMESKWQF